MQIAVFLDGGGVARTGVPVAERQARLLIPRDGGTWEQTDQVADVRQFLPPVQPPNIFAIGRNYRAHAEETGAKLPEAPLIFQKATTSLIAHEATIVLPAPAPHEVDFEAELAIVIGRTARCVAPEAALEYVAGYTCANDVSARDCQRNDKQWARAKGFDTFCPLGPWLVTASDLDPDRVAIRSRLNGRIMQESNAVAANRDSDRHAGGRGLRAETSDISASRRPDRGGD
jgi:2-keto-4-pentenoate hydratase/2-oxohepta-3-ene-1,7-dioic acid hydratase in catechol pathway